MPAVVGIDGIDGPHDAVPQAVARPGDQPTRLNGRSRQRFRRRRRIDAGAEIDCWDRSGCSRPQAKQTGAPLPKSRALPQSVRGRLLKIAFAELFQMVTVGTEIFPGHSATGSTLTAETPPTLRARVRSERYQK